MDRHRFDVDQDPTSHFDANPDPDTDPDQDLDPTPNLYMSESQNFFGDFYSQQSHFTLFSI